jgi:hypothetical protein
VENKELKIPQDGEFIRNIGTLVKVETIQPPIPKPYNEYIFEEILARIELRFGKEVLKEFDTFCDFYGLNKSVEESIRSANQYAKDRKLNKNSELEIVVVKIVRQFRASPRPEEPNYCAKEYMNFKPCENYRYRRDVLEPIETVVWSSKEVESWDKENE